MNNMNQVTDTHSKTVGYILWIVGFMGAHRFYYGRKLTGILWFFTAGLFLIGWIVDLFLIPSMDASADRRYASGQIDYSIAWALLVFLGIFGIHRFYQGKILSGVLYLISGGIFGIGYVYDLLTLNEQVDELNRAQG